MPLDSSDSDIDSDHDDGTDVVLTENRPLTELNHGTKCHKTEANEQSHTRQVMWQQHCRPCTPRALHYKDTVSWYCFGSAMARI